MAQFDTVVCRWHAQDRFAGVRQCARDRLAQTGGEGDVRVAKRPTHKWTFPARFRARAYGWKSSRLACQRVREAVSEIKKVARKDAVLAAEGAVRLIEKLSPALEQVDSSSGAIGSAVYRAIETLVDIIGNTPVDGKTRTKWLNRLWQAYQDDQIPYIENLGDHWGTLCASEEVASEWADRLLSITQRCLSPDREPGEFFCGSTACLSALLKSQRHEELLSLVQGDSRLLWHYRKFGVDALKAMGRKAEALQFAEDSRGLNQPDGAIDRECEDILISSGMNDEAYQRYGLYANSGSTYLARFRALAKRYPMKNKAAMLADLIETTPGEEGKWFATAKDLGFLRLALDLVEKSPCEPKTLNRAAKAFLQSDPEFALGVSMASLKWLCQGWGYEIAGVDVLNAFDSAVQAAERLGVASETKSKIQQVVATDTSPGMFVRDVLTRRLTLI